MQVPIHSYTISVSENKRKSLISTPRPHHRNENTDSQQQSTGTSEYRGYQFCNQTETNNYIKSYSHYLTYQLQKTKPSLSAQASKTMPFPMQ